jgi:hypothetical protein
VPAEVLANIGPQQTPADDPEHLWPVFLGRVLRDNSDPTHPVYSVDLSNRPYAGLVGEAVRAPSGDASVVVGNAPNPSTETDAAPLVATRLAVYLAEDQCGVREALRIDSDGELTINGKARIYGDVQLSGGALEFQVGSGTAATRNCGTTPTGEAMPWSIYRYHCNGSGTSGVQQLRLELPDDGGGAGEVVIGAWSPDDKVFKPVLTVSNNSTVVVHGNLVVEGRIDQVAPQSTASAARKLTAEAENFLLGSYAGGIGGANLQIGKFYHSPFGEAVDLNTPKGIENAVNYIAADNTRLQTLIAVLLANPVVSHDYVAGLLATDSGRRLVMDRLATDPSARNGFALLLKENVYRDVLEPFAGNLVQTADGREAIMTKLPSASSELNAFADLLTDARFVNRTDEFAGAVVRTDDGRRGVMQSLPANSTELNSFSGLLQEAAYADRLPTFAHDLMATDAGRRASLEHGLPLNSAALAAYAALLRDFYPAWLDAILATAQGTPAGTAAIAANLLATAGGRSAAVQELLGNANNLQDVVDQLLNDTEGRRATAYSFDGTGAGDAAATARRTKFADLDWLSLGHAPATPADWTAQYGRFAATLRPRMCP